MPEKPNVTLPGTVEKIIPSSDPSEPEKAQISVKTATICIKKSESRTHCKTKTATRLH